jgi:hypothetical protein
MIRIQRSIIAAIQQYTLTLPKEFQMIRIGFDDFYRYLFCLFEPRLLSIFRVLTNQKILIFND